LITFSSQFFDPQRTQKRLHGIASFVFNVKLEEVIFIQKYYKVARVDFFNEKEVARSFVNTKCSFVTLSAKYSLARGQCHSLTQVSYSNEKTELSKYSSFMKAKG
jgi:hypothetical protein